MSLYKDISGDHQLNDINTSVRPVLSLYDEKTKISTLGTRKVFVLNPATKEEIIIQFRIVDEDFTPLIGLNDSEALKLIAVLQDNIALVEAAKPSVPSTASEVLTPLTMETILSKYSQVFDDTIGKFEGELHLYTKQECPPHKTAPREIPLSVKNNFIAEIKDLQEQGILEKVTEPTDWVSAPTMVNKPSAKNGIRLCIDSRPLNTALKRMEYPIPTVDNLLTEIGMTTSPTQRFLNRRTKTEIPMKATLLTPELAEKVLEEKAKKTKKSQAYYDRTAKDLTELKPGDTVRIRPDGLVKGQEWRKGSVVQIHGYRSYDVKVDGKVLNRNRVHLKPEQKVSAPTMPSDARKPNKQTIVPVQKSGVNPREAKQTVKPAEPAVNMELITAKRTRSGRLVKVPARYLP